MRSSSCLVLCCVVQEQVWYKSSFKQSHKENSKNNVQYFYYRLQSPDWNSNIVVLPLQALGTIPVKNSNSKVRFVSKHKVLMQDLDTADEITSLSQLHHYKSFLIIVRFEESDRVIYAPHKTFYCLILKVPQIVLHCTNTMNGTHLVHYRADWRGSKSCHFYSIIMFLVFTSVEKKSQMCKSLCCIYFPNIVVPFPSVTTQTQAARTVRPTELAHTTCESLTEV